MTYGEAQARNISYKAWRYMCEQEEIEREQAEEEAKFQHDVALARAVLHCPDPMPEEVRLVKAALESPIARWIQEQLAIERRLS